MGYVSGSDGATHAVASRSLWGLLNARARCIFFPRITDHRAERPAMAKRQGGGSDGTSWERAEELLGRGDPAFVDELRRLSDAERLGKFAARWYKDRRPAARQLLLEYLSRPLNAFRHEALVKR